MESDLTEDPCAGYVIDDSDLEYSDCSEESSDDELNDKINNKGLMSYMKIQHTANDSSSDDDFEKQMDDEANNLVSKLMASSTQVQSDEVKSKDKSDIKGTKDEYYNEVYFDSSSDDENQLTEDKVLKKKSKMRKLTNDELLYDPNMDDDNEKWVERQRMAYHNVMVSEKLSKKQKSLDGDKKSTSKIPSSDATLNCPACMCTLCIDCQRHELYSGQFRAMFVLNCKVIKDEVLHYKPKQQRRKKRNRKDGIESEISTENYYPVRCSICNTEVAVYDNEQVFHFFNVLSTP